MTVRLSRDMGMPIIIEYARRFGVYDNLMPVLSMALGAFLAGMEWFENFNGGNDFISQERIDGLSVLEK